jgi:NhaP-type Na+/H+ or K+/H+ antiporter
MKSRAWSNLVAFFGVIALLLLALSILGAIPIRGAIIRYPAMSTTVILPVCILACCIAEFIRSRRSARPAWFRFTFVVVIVTALGLSYVITCFGHARREADTRPLSELQMKEVDTAVATATPSPP